MLNQIKFILTNKLCFYIISKRFLLQKNKMNNQDLNKNFLVAKSDLIVFHKNILLGHKT